MKIFKFKHFKTYFDKIDGQSLQPVVNKLEGRFVLFFIADDGLYASSDQFGKLDIYYQQNKTNITLASSLDLLPESPAKGGFNQVSLIHTLTNYGYHPPKKHTLYKKVKRLGVHERVEWKNEKFSLVKEKNVLHNTFEFDLKEQHDTYANLFLDAIEKTIYQIEKNRLCLQVD